MTIVEKGIGGLREALAEMVAATREMLDVAVRALDGEDGASPETVQAMDVRLNQYELKLDHMCQTLLILREPYAVDFRYIFCTIKVTRDLERMGDEVKFASRWISGIGRNAPEDLRALGHRARDLFRSATNALLSCSAEGAREVLAEDPASSALEEKVLRETNDVGVAAVAHALGRIAARSTNIAENVIYVVEARDVRHPDDAG